MQDMPGENCRCGDPDQHDRPGHCDDCGQRLVWLEREGGAMVKACPDCE